jgi:hypothetical protein
MFYLKRELRGNKTVFSKFDPTIEATMSVLGSIMVATSSAMMFFFLIIQFPIIIKTQWVKLVAQN